MVPDDDRAAAERVAALFEDTEVVAADAPTRDPSESIFREASDSGAPRRSRRRIAASPRVHHRQARAQAHRSRHGASTAPRSQRPLIALTLAAAVVVFFGVLLFGGSDTAQVSPSSPDAVERAQRERPVPAVVGDSVLERKTSARMAQAEGRAQAAAARRERAAERRRLARAARLTAARQVVARKRAARRAAAVRARRAAAAPRVAVTPSAVVRPPAPPRRSQPAASAACVEFPPC